MNLPNLIFETLIKYPCLFGEAIRKALFYSSEPKISFGLIRDKKDPIYHKMKLIFDNHFDDSDCKTIQQPCIYSDRESKIHIITSGTFIAIVVEPYEVILINQTHRTDGWSFINFAANFQTA